MSKSKTKPKYRRPLNAKQLHVLKLLYKFRFVTTDLLLKHTIAKTNAVIQGRLNVLLSQEYIGRHYDGSYRLQNKHATYYILPKGINILKAQGLEEAVLHSMYKDRSASQRFIDHSLRVFSVYCQLQRLHHNAFNIYSKSELSQQEEFPKPRPDLYLNGQQSYFLEYIDSSTPFFAVRQLVSRYIAHEENGEWEGDYPTLLLICETGALETRLLKHLDKIGDSSDIECLATTTKALSMSTHASDPIWSNSFEDKASKALEV